MDRKMIYLEDIKSLVDKGYIFYCSHSGGKDSQAMYALLKQFVPHEQISVVHADLGEVEWDGVKGHIESNIEHQLNVVKAVWKDGSEKDLLGYVKHRFKVRPDAPSWPSSANRWCTSELKTGPIRKFIRHDLKRRGKLLGINCIGIRASESTARSKKKPWQLNTELSRAGRTVYDWMPIFDYSTDQVFETIKNAGQKPFWAYEKGNERLSCVFCILGSDNDIQNGFKYRPELAAKYMEIEKQVGYSMFHKKSLADRLIPIKTLKEQN